MRKHTRLLAVLLTAVLLVSVLPAMAAEKHIVVNTGISVYLDGAKLKLTDATGATVEAFASEGTTYVPVRAVSEALDLTVGWDGATNTVSLTGTPRNIVGQAGIPAVAGVEGMKNIPITGGISIQMNGKKLTPTDVNGKVVDVFASNGTTYLPIRAVTTALGLGVEWDGGTRSVYLTTDGGSTGGNTSPTPSATPAPTTKTLVAPELTEDPLSYTVTKSSVYVQDLGKFATSDLTVKSVSKAKDGLTQSIDFSGNAVGVAVVEEYVETICNGGYNLKLVDKHVESYKKTVTASGGDFVSWVIDYTGTGPVTYTRKAMFTSKESNVNVYYTLQDGKLSGDITIPTEMEFVDLGLRQGGKTESAGIAGPSAMAGLYQMPDGSYQTSDGRLTAALGQADVRRGGVAYTGKTSSKLSSGDGQQTFKIEGFYRDESVSIVVPANRLLEGDLVTGHDQRNGNASYLSYEFHLADSYLTWEDFTLRVLRLNDTEAVFYLYADLEKEPGSIEALFAIDLTQTEQKASSGSSSGSSVVDTGTTRMCPTCHGDGEVECTFCGGEGRLRKNYTKEQGWDYEFCSTCMGHGMVKCRKCDCTGRV